jgi:hypothetical protein
MGLAKQSPLRIGTVLERIQNDGFALVCLVHTLPFLQPLSLGPVSTAAGLSLASLGGQMTAGKLVPWLPRRMANLVLSAKVWGILLKTCERVVRYCRKYARPRLTGLAVGPRARRASGLVVAAGGILLAVPLAGVPFSNTLPALAVLFASIAELEEDGVFMIFAWIALALTLAYFGLLAWAALYAADHAWDWFRFRHAP